MTFAEELSFDEVLTTTRSVRRRFDLDRAVDLSVIHECLEIAVQAPSGSNKQNWAFVLVQDPGLRRRLGELYRAGFERYRARPGSVFAQRPHEPSAAHRQARLATSVKYLADHIAEVPLHVIPCITGRIDPAATPPSAVAAFMASIIPATWSFMLACRSRGLGTCWTTFHLSREREAAELLGIPYDEVTQIALIPVGHTTQGSFRPAERGPLSTVVRVDHW